MSLIICCDSCKFLWLDGFPDASQQNRSLNPMFTSKFKHALAPAGRNMASSMSVPIDASTLTVISAPYVQYGDYCCIVKLLAIIASEYLVVSHH